MKKGFALPTVLIASVVLLMVLAVSVTATTAARNGLKTQYYSQLAQTAGEAGVAFANACLRLSGNVPTWTDAKPLTSATNCNGDVQSGYPATVMTNGNIQSKFRVGLPPLDADGRALTIPQTGFVEVIRSSSGAVWRTYQQPSSQSVAVPDLCSGAARSDLGWRNAVISPTAVPLTGNPVIQTISSSTGSDVYAGNVTYRKDFSIATAGSYTFRARASNNALVYINGGFIGETTTSGRDFAVNLGVGCNVVTIQEVRSGTAASYSGVALAGYRTGGTALVVSTDKTWRVSTGLPVSAKSSNYYEAGSPGWDRSKTIPLATANSMYPGGSPDWYSTDWYTHSGGYNSEWVSATDDYTTPAGSYSYFRSAPTRWIFPSQSEVQISVACDGACKVFVDGQQVLSNNSHTWKTIASTKVTLSAGRHQVYVELQNTSATAKSTAFFFNARYAVSKANIDRSDANWARSLVQYSQPDELYSYEANSRPSPDIYDCNCTRQAVTNLSSNPSFESGATNATPTRVTSAASSSAAYDKLNGLRNTVSEVGTGQQVSLPIWIAEPGMTYRISAYVRAGVNVRMGYWVNSRTGLLPINGNNINFSPFVAGDGTWRRISMVVPPLPAGVNQLHIVLGLPDNTPLNTVFDVDAVMASHGPTLHTYADATSPGWRGANYGYIMSSGPVL